MSERGCEVSHVLGSPSPFLGTSLCPQVLLATRSDGDSPDEARHFTTGPGNATFLTGLCARLGGPVQTDGPSFRREPWEGAVGRGGRALLTGRVVGRGPVPLKGQSLLTAERAQPGVRARVSGRAAGRAEPGREEGAVQAEGEDDPAAILPLRGLRSPALSASPSASAQ